MSDDSLLARVGGPAILTLKTASRDAAEDARRWVGSGLRVRTIRGQKTRRLAGLFDECAAALQFPLYFGENWAAFDECLSDLFWVQPPAGLVVLVCDANAVLSDESGDELRALVQSIEDAHATYSTPIEAGEWWDRPAVPFHVVLQHDPTVGLGRWVDAGASMTSL